MGVAARVAMGVVIIVGLLRMRAVGRARNAQLPQDLVEMPRRLLALIWIGIGIGLALLACRRLIPAESLNSLGLTPAKLSNSSAVIGFGLMALANLLDLIRVRRLSS